MIAYQLIGVYGNHLSSQRRHRSPVLIVMIGAPGAGKTTHAKWMAKWLGALRVATDDIKEEFRAQHVPFAISDLFEVQRQILRLGMTNRVNLIADSNSDRSIHQSVLEDLAREHCYRVIYVACLAPAHCLADRLHKRSITKGRQIGVSTEEVESIAGGLVVPAEAIRLKTNCAILVNRWQLFMRLLPCLISQWRDNKWRPQIGSTTLLSL